MLLPRPGRKFVLPLFPLLIVIAALGLSTKASAQETAVCFGRGQIPGWVVTGFGRHPSCPPNGFGESPNFMWMAQPRHGLWMCEGASIFPPGFYTDLSLRQRSDQCAQAVDRPAYAIILLAAGGGPINSGGNPSAGAPIRNPANEMTVCSTGDPGVTLRNPLRDTVWITYKGRLVYQASEQEGKSWMGGKGNSLLCNEIRSTKRIMAIRQGWANDMVQLFAFDLDYSGNVIATYVYDWYSRDGYDFNVNIEGDESVTVRFGRKKDLKTRFCFDQNRKIWRWNSNYRNQSTFLPCNEDLPTRKVLPRQ